MILLLSDLHLPNRPSPLRDGFRRFLEGPARDAEAVYLLGDLFEYWVGDDVGLQDYAAEVRWLRELTAQGVPVWFIAGNRDFLVGPRFFSASGVRPRGDPTRLDLDGVPTLLSHGDLYCTDDRAYQRWRRFAHHRLAQRLFGWLPRKWRLAIGGGLRRQSGGAKQTKTAAIMDVNPHSVAAGMLKAGVVRLIHGHTHRPDEHAVGEHGQRIVLADWHGERMEYLALAGGRWQRCLLPNPSGEQNLPRVDD